NSAFPQTKTKTVTNADLEKFRQKRLQNEREYRENYEKLNFPSPDELARQREQSRLENEETIIRRKEERLENENDFAARASALRSEMISVEAQINYVLSLFPANRPPTSYYTGGVAPFGYARNGQSNSIWSGDATGRAFLGGARTYTPNPRSSFGNVRQTPLTRDFYGRSQIYGNSGTRINIGIGTGRLPGRQYDPRHIGRRQSLGYYVPFVSGGYDYTQDDLAAQLRSLEQERAGLYAEWRLLQENAKQAGVKID
ncbi:MAG TPA: hypothetical protein VGD05_09385, partial [Pyrinomonadaceae bacterium]